MKILLLILITLLPCEALSQIIKNPTDSDCKSWFLWKESRGEGSRTQRAVLDVLHHRMEKKSKTACQVLKEKGQFPYFKKGVKRVPKEFLTTYLKVISMKPVLTDKRYIYFNHVKHPWGKGTKKIGQMFFAR